jgi:hypothetical protein
MIGELPIEFHARYHSWEIELFNARDARKVLKGFGQTMAGWEEDMSVQQLEFLNNAVDGATQDGSVIPVRLAILTEGLKGVDWTGSKLAEVGGTHGATLLFLKSMFNLEYSDPRYKLHKIAAQRVLDELLPKAPTEVESEKRSLGSLFEVSRYQSRKKFLDLIRILDEELKLITPAYSVDQSPPGDPPWEDMVYYKLSHRFLVPPVREWITGQHV